jgi:hypothetical protein
MNIEPFSKIGHISLDLSPDELEQILGAPAGRRTNRIGLVELDYGGSVYRFEPNGMLCEVTIEAPLVELGNVSIPFAKLGEFVGNNDPHSAIKHGFILSPSYGIAFDPEHQPWVTVLTKRALETWAKL